MAHDPSMDAPPPPKKSNTIWWVLGCGALLVIGLGIASPFLCCGGLLGLGAQAAAEQEKKVDTEAGTSVTAEELTKAYDDNAGTADTKYKDKVLIVTGKVTSADANSISLEPATIPGKAVFNVSCSFSDKHKGDLASVKTGDTVKVKGYCSGQLLGTNLKYCQIVK